MSAVRIFAFDTPGGQRHLAVAEPGGRGTDLGRLELTALIGRARAAGQWPASLVRELADGAPEPGGLLFDDERAVAVRGSAALPLGVPLIPPETWAAGVTYIRSRDARQAETATSTRDIYTRVYEAERPELFLKDAAGRRTVPTGKAIRVRSDSLWSVPEPELAVILDAGGRIVGYTAGNDVSARDIEGANPLYLPQAKVYAGSCALGPAVLLVDDETTRRFSIELLILAPDGGRAFAGVTTTERMARPLPELVGALFRDNPIADGTVLLTGTGVVPPDDYRLTAGQRVEIRIGDVGLLWNHVEGGPPE